MKFAPIIFFCYNRSELALRTLVNLEENPEARKSELFVFIDGLKKEECD